MGIDAKHQIIGSHEVNLSRKDQQKFKTATDINYVETNYVEDKAPTEKYMKLIDYQDTQFEPFMSRRHHPK